MPDQIMICLLQNLDAKGYGIKRIGEIQKRYERYKAIERDAGRSDIEASRTAEQNTLLDMEYTVQAKAHMLRNNTAKLADIKVRVNDAANLRDVREAGISLWEDNPKFSGKNVTTLQRNYHGRYWAIMGSVLDNFSKGAFGRQLGKAHFPDVVRELFGNSTGNKAAKEIAEAYKRVQKVMIADFRKAGGVMRELVDFNLPQGQSAVKMITAGREAWIGAHMNWLDWNKMRWPDGQLIPEAERARVLDTVYTTLKSNGKEDIEVSLGGGQGASVGNMLDKHRFLIYKDADSWMAMHSAYGDGSVYDVITRHIEHMAHKNAMVDVWGTNPQAMVAAARKQMVKHAGSVQETLKKKAALSLKRFDAVSENMLRLNAMDDSGVAHAVMTTSNLATAAMLKAATLLAITGDLVTSLAVRFAQGQGGYARFLGEYLKAMFPGGYRAAGEELGQMGFIYDELVSNEFIAARFGAGHHVGTGWSRRAADFTMRASWMTRHTSAMRGANQKEMMAALQNARNLTLDKTPFRVAARRAGITDAEWDRVRAEVAAWNPRGNAKFIRPLDILDMKHGSRDAIYNKFQSMVSNESYRMVPSALAEGQAIFKGSTRPDTAYGILAHSFAMFKSYPISYILMYRRLATNLDESAGHGRIKLVGALISGAVLSGAFGLQMRNLAAGREFEDMDPSSEHGAKFWFRAFIAGGGASIYGDFITGAMSEEPASKIASILGGPLVGEVAEGLDIVAGGFSHWTGLSDKTSEFAAERTGQRALDFARKYLVPGAWQANLVIERELWDRGRYAIDAATARKVDAARVQKQKRMYGNNYYAPPGKGVFTGP